MECFFRNHLLPRLIQLSSKLERRRNLRATSTTKITNAVYFAANECGGSCELEYPLNIYRGKDIQGYIDAHITFRDGTRYAIEIDRGNKMWSLVKLQHCSEVLNCSSIWIRWAGCISREIPTGICVVDMTNSTVKIIGEKNLKMLNKTQ
jgi:hypothetical protein